MHPYDMFVESLKSPATKIAYKTFFKKYLEFMGLVIEVDSRKNAKLVEEKIKEFMGEVDLFCQNNTKLIEEKIIEFIVSLKERGLSHSAIRNYVFCAISFYKINDVMLNTGKISRFLPEYKKMKEDRGYNHEEIHKLLEFADERLRAVILLMASTGMRIGAIPDLRVGDLNDTKITIYKGGREQYFSFITPECKEAIDLYLDMRRRYGENITSDSYLIRNQFNVRKPSKPKKTIADTLYGKLRELSIRSGVRDKNLPVCHGFRKFFSTQTYESNVKSEARWLMEGHNLKANDTSYVKTSDKALFQEYQKAINNLTTNEENRLKIKVEKLEAEKDKFDMFAMGVANNFRKIQDKLTKMTADGKYLTDEDWGLALDEFGITPNFGVNKRTGQVHFGS